MPKIHEDEIDKARHADLAEYLRMQGYTLKKEGKSYRVQDFGGGMIVTGYKWYWQAQKIGGKSVDFLVNVMGMSFKDAVNALNDNDVPSLPKSSSGLDAMGMPDDKPLKMPEKANNERRVIAYLCQQRNIHYDIVQRLLCDNAIYQDTRGNCVFVVRDDTGCPVGAELHGTGYTRYKQSTRHTGYGFTLHCGRNQTGAMFFESGIDLLSYYQLHKDKLSHHDLVSLAGVGNYDTILQYHKRYPDRKICICSDNDDSGDGLIRKIQAELGCHIYVHRTPRNVHDWNDMLCPSVPIGNEIECDNVLDT